jgi:hypothetical protein
MTNKQILNKAFEKAKRNGWKTEITNPIPTRREGKRHGRKLYFYIIFSHDFAKAFWGEEINKCSGDKYHLSCCGGCGILEEGWQYHLTEMVLEKDPLKYLEQFLGE